MAILNSWQRIDRVIPGKPWGDGASGAISTSTIPTMAVKVCTGTATSTTLTADTDASPFAVGDVLLLQTSQGTNVGQWEINRVTVVGSDQYTMKKALKYTYAADSVAIIVERYTNATISSGTWTLTEWGGTTGGILVFACNGTYTQTGAMSGNYKGFRGGARAGDPPGTGTSGEGGNGTPGTAATGAGIAGQYTAPGGGYGTAGTKGQGSNGTVGAAYGSADLTVISHGGAGAGNAASPSTAAGQGRDSGGIAMIFAKTVASPTGVASMTGQNGDAGSDRGGGAGSGGAILIVCQTATLGTNKFTAAGGTGGVGTSGEDGGNGGVGRIAVHHFGTVTGTTSPTFEDTTDTSLKEGSGFLGLL